MRERIGYYPFGLTFNSYQRVTAQKNPFKYNGKEEITDLGVNWYDYGQRNYDAALGRFFNVDRFSEKYHNLNPYQYGLNNPVLFIDINGDSTVYYDYDGNVLHTSHDELENAVVFIEDDNLEFFNTEVSNFSGDGKGNNDDTNSALRTMCSR